MSSPLDEPLGKAAAIALVEVYLLTFQVSNFLRWNFTSKFSTFK